MPTPTLVTSALILKDDSILLLRNLKNPNQWSFPGGVGAWEKTSDPLESVILEVEGDIGVVLRVSSSPTITAHLRNLR